MNGVTGCNHNIRDGTSACRRLRGDDYIRIQLLGISSRKTAASGVRPKFGGKPDGLSSHGDVAIGNSYIQNVKARNRGGIAQPQKFPAHFVVCNFRYKNRDAASDMHFEPVTTTVCKNKTGALREQPERSGIEDDYIHDG